MKTPIRILVLLFLIMSSCMGKDNAFRDKYRWISGKWKGQNDQTIMIESWKWNKFRFEGVGYEILAGDTVFKERMFLESFDGSEAYIVLLQEKPPILFSAADGDENEYVFINLDHDFPQRLTYVAESDTSLTISLLAKGEPKEYEISYQLKRLTQR